MRDFISPREVLQTLNGLKSGKDKASVDLGLFFTNVDALSSFVRKDMQLSRFTLRAELPTACAIDWFRDRTLRHSPATNSMLVAGCRLIFGT